MISKYNKGTQFLLSIIYILYILQLSKLFKKSLYESGNKPNKIWVDNGSKFYNAINQWNHGYKTMILTFIQTIMKEKLLLLRDLLEPKRIRSIYLRSKMCILIG